MGPIVEVMATTEMSGASGQVGMMGTLVASWPP